MEEYPKFYIRCLRCGKRKEFATWEETRGAAKEHDKEQKHKLYDTNVGIEFRHQE